MRRWILEPALTGRVDVGDVAEDDVTTGATWVEGVAVVALRTTRPQQGQKVASASELHDVGFAAGTVYYVEWLRYELACGWNERLD